MTPSYRTILVALVVSVLPGSYFSFFDACLFVNTYSSSLRLEHATQIQVEQALEYFLQSGLIEIVSNNHAMRKLGRGSRASEIERVSGGRFIYFTLTSFLLHIFPHSFISL